MTPEQSSTGAPARCAHQGCTCTVSTGQRFCSEHCARQTADASSGQRCGCGHPGCN